MISPEEITVGAELLGWAEKTLMGEAEALKRPYSPRAVCPFVEATIKKNALFFAFHGEVTEGNHEMIEKVVESEAALFAESSQPANGYRALLVVFPHLSRRCYGVLDAVQASIKDKMVESGLMVGQFHPECQTPAIHNPAWRGVSVAPYPLMAIRHMVVHDILFLKGKRHWFAQYQKRFGAWYEREGRLGALNPHFVAAYSEAKEKFMPLLEVSVA